MYVLTFIIITYAHNIIMGIGCSYIPGYANIIALIVTNNTFTHKPTQSPG